MISMMRVNTPNTPNSSSHICQSPRNNYNAKYQSTTRPALVMHNLHYNSGTKNHAIAPPAPCPHIQPRSTTESKFSPPKTIS